MRCFFSVPSLTAEAQQCPGWPGTCPTALCHVEMSTGGSFCPSSHTLGSREPTAHVLSEVCMENDETEGDVSSSSFTSLPVWLAFWASNVGDKDLAMF